MEPTDSSAPAAVPMLGIWNIQGPASSQPRSLLTTMSYFVPSLGPDASFFFYTCSATTDPYRPPSFHPHPPNSLLSHARCLVAGCSSVFMPVPNSMARVSISSWNGSLLLQRIRLITMHHHRPQTCDKPGTWCHARVSRPFLSDLCSPNCPAPRATQNSQNQN